MSENSMEVAFTEQMASFYNKSEAAASQSVLMASLVSSLPRTTPASKRMRTISTDSDSLPAPRRRLGTVITRDDIPLPGRDVMHLAPFLKLKSARLVSNLPILFAAPAWDAVKAQGTQVDKRFNKTTRAAEFEKVAGHESVPIASLPQLRKAQDYREMMVTAFAAALIEHSAIARQPTFLEWRKTPKSLQLGSAEASAALASGYVSIDDTVLGSSEAFRTSWRAALDALHHFSLSDIRVTDFQAICAPLNDTFPLHLIELVAQEHLDLDSFDCRGYLDPVYYCESKDCQVGSLCRRAVTGRPTGVDSERVFALLQQAPKYHGPKVPITAEEKLLVSLFLHILWAKAVAVDATCITVSGGNKEILFIRVRKTQTFFMSKVLDIPRPPRPEPSHTSVHTGYDMFAFLETTERALFNKEHERGGTLPVSMRTLYDVDINPLKSALDFSVLAPIYEVSVGTFLPPRLSDGSYTFYKLRRLFEDAIRIKLQWEEGDVDTTSEDSVFKDVTSPLTMSVEDPSTEVQRWDITLHAKIHCRKRHGSNVYICHLFHDPVEPHIGGRPYGLSLLMKISRDVDAIKKESDTLKALEHSVPKVACRIPKAYHRFSNSAIGETGISALFMEHFDGCYPLAIVDDFSFQSLIDMTDWKGALNREQKWVHTELSVKNILFKPSDPGCFYVVGWGRAHAITDQAEEAIDGAALSGIFNRVKKRKVLDQPLGKKPRMS